MVHGIVDIFKCSYFFSVCMSACSLFLASLCPSFYGAAFERLLTSFCLCANIRQCRTTLSLNRYPPLRFLFVLLNFNCSLSAAHSVYLNFLKFVFICCEGAIASLPWTAHFYFPLKGPLPFQWWKIKWPAQRYFCCRIQQRNVLKSHFTVTRWLDGRYRVAKMYGFFL